VLPDSCIVRTSWVFGTGGKCFPDTILKLASDRDEIAVVNDQRGCPTYARDLAGTIVQLRQKDASGTVHATNGGNCTWFEFASEIVRRTGLSTKVLPATTDKFPRPAKRPKYSVLSNESLRARAISLKPWQDALADYLKERTLSLSVGHNLLSQQ
jgi:dTDP-4-dehydrorhamnose reductase